MIATIIPSTIVPLAEDPPTCTLVGNSLVTVGQEFLLSSAMIIIMVNNSHSLFCRLLLYARCT